jgi:hypothetical protein
MASSSLEIDDPRLPPTRGMTGPVTAARQRRTWSIYLTLVATGALPWIFGASAGWQAAGIGLWLPGAGFLAVGGWWTLLFPLILFLFIASIVAWFWAGVVLAPVTVWGGSAIAAGLLAEGATWVPAPFLAGAVAVTIGMAFRSRNLKKAEAGVARAKKREAFLSSSMAEVAEQSRAQPDPTQRELDGDQLAALRYLLDRCLQPVGSFDGFTIIDQFQPAALRYQINHMGFALAIAQAAYLPNFRGYMGLAQRNLIEKYLERKVWDYWIYESCWGHLNFTNWDPAARDNIMLTGWFGAHVGGYMLASGDRRYLEPGSLTFRLNAKTAYRHDFTTLVRSVVDNYESAEFGHYPCEPNWIYPICNHYGMLALATSDALLDTDHVSNILPRWLEKLDTEFTDSSGSIVGLRSQHTGMPVPFPVGESGYSYFENSFAPARARRLWAIARREIASLIRDEPDGPRMVMPGAGLDAGHYKSGHTASYASYLIAAREFGDSRVAEAAIRGLEADCKPVRDSGVLAYTMGSNISNASAIMGLLMETGDFRRTFTHGANSAALAGPMIETLDYPEVLVTRAWSDGVRLEAVFLPGASPGRRTIGLSHLSPGKLYLVDGAVEGHVEADGDGHGTFSINLDKRVEVRLRPAG